jgi:hypothetical protein
MIEPAQIAQIEAVERDAWLDIDAAAPPPIRSALGIVQRRLDDGALLICSAIDHLQFNRTRLSRHHGAGAGRGGRSGAR